MRTLAPEVIKSCFHQYQCGDFSVADVAKHHHIAYNTAKHLDDVFHNKGIKNKSLCNLSYSQVFELCYGERKADNNGYFAIDYEEVFCLIDTHNYDLTESYQVYLVQANKSQEKGHKYNTYSYSQFCKKLKQERAKTPSHVLVHKHGHSVQVDFSGRKGDVNWIDQDNVKHGLEMFVACLPSSGVIFCYPVQNQQIDNWLLCHEKLFSFLGGVTPILISDNLKSAVTTPSGRGRKAVINWEFQELSEHYAFFVKPAATKKSKGKTAGEKAVHLVEIWLIKILRRESFFSFEHLLKRIEQLLIKINSRAFKGSSRWQRFYENELPLLKALPEATVNLGRWILPKVVHNNGYIQVEKTWYSLPEKYISKKVIPKLYAETVELYFDGRNKHFLIASHARSYVEGDYVTEPSHTKKSKREREVNSYQHYLIWAKQTGSSFLLSLIKAQLDLKKDDLKTREACQRYYNIYTKHKADGEKALRQFFIACEQMLQFDKKSVTDFKQTIALIKKQPKRDERIVTREINSK